MSASGIAPIPLKEQFNCTGPLFSAAELEFLAENALVSIKPRRKIEEIDLLSGTYGPFRPNRICEVPLWVAVVLRKGNHCELVPPIWLRKEYLTEVLNEEYNSKDDYQKLPDHYLEVSLLLLECSAGCSDIPDAEEVRRLIQSLREVRHQKTLEGLKLIDGDPLKLNNISMMELNEIRPFLLPTMDQLVLLKKKRLEERASEANSFTGAASYTF